MLTLREKTILIQAGRELEIILARIRQFPQIQSYDYQTQTWIARSLTDLEQNLIQQGIAIHNTAMRMLMAPAEPKKDNWTYWGLSDKADYHLLQSRSATLIRLLKLTGYMEWCKEPILPRRKPERRIVQKRPNLTLMPPRKRSSG